MGPSHCAPGAAIGAAVWIQELPGVRCRTVAESALHAQTANRQVNRDKTIPKGRGRNEGDNKGRGQSERNGL